VIKQKQPLQLLKLPLFMRQKHLSGQ